MKMILFIMIMIKIWALIYFPSILKNLHEYMIFWSHIPVIYYLDLSNELPETYWQKKQSSCYAVRFCRAGIQAEFIRDSLPLLHGDRGLSWGDARAGNDSMARCWRWGCSHVDASLLPGTSAELSTRTPACRPLCVVFHKALVFFIACGCIPRVNIPKRASGSWITLYDLSSYSFWSLRLAWN